MGKIGIRAEPASSELLLPHHAHTTRFEVLVSRDHSVGPAFVIKTPLSAINPKHPMRG
jgi:hypothetical protein